MDLVIRVFYTSDTAEAEGDCIPVRLEHAQFSGTIRLLFDPTVGEWPCFAALGLSFMAQPTIELSLCAGGSSKDAMGGGGGGGRSLSISDIPLLSDWLQRKLHDAVAGALVWPKVAVAPDWRSWMGTTRF